MKKGERFRLSKPMVGVRLEDDKNASTVEIPRDSVIEIVRVEETLRKMLEANWRGIRVMLFVEDVRERGELVDGFYKSLKRCCDFEPEKSFRYGRAHRSRGHNL